MSFPCLQSLTQTFFQKVYTPVATHTGQWWRVRLAFMGPILFCSRLFCHGRNVKTEFPTRRHTFTALLLTPEAGEKLCFFHMTGPFLAGGDPFTTGRARTLAPGTVQPTRRDRDRL